MTRRVLARSIAVALVLTAPAAGSRSSLAAQSRVDLEQQVRERERAFARTMADRNHPGFISFLADEAVFLAPDRVLRGRTEVAEGWKRFYGGPQAPFAWEPERVHVVESGTLAVSTGPVTDPQGKRIGTFTSTWRREKDGQWRIVLDSGCPPCPCK
jgi:ketosteroid isomerase-like protein